MATRAKSPATLAAQSQIDADPDYQRWIGEWQSQAKAGNTPRTSGVNSPSHTPAHHIDTPHDTFLNPGTGQVEDESLFARNPWLAPVLMGGGLVGAQFLPGVMGAGGAASSAGAGAGAGATTATAAPAAAVAGGGMGGMFSNPMVMGSIIQALAGMGSAALAPGGQEREGYTGDVAPQPMMEQSNDFMNSLRMAMEGLPPIDLSGQSAPLPNDPSGRVPTAPRRRPLAPQPQPGPASTGGANGRRDGALALLRSLGTAA